MGIGRAKGHPKTGGRTLGVPNKITAEIKDLARVFGPAGINRLAEIAFDDTPVVEDAVKDLKALIEEGAPPWKIAKFARAAFQIRSDQTCVAAIKELFDRGYGKSIQPIAGSADGSPIQMESRTVIVLPANARD